MKRVSEIKTSRMERLFKKRMDAHKHIKRQQMEIELAKHIDLIDDDRIKQYIAKKRKNRLMLMEKKRGVQHSQL